MFSSLNQAFAQGSHNQGLQGEPSMIKELRFITETSEYTLKDDFVIYQGKRYLLFEYDKNNEQAEVEIHPANPAYIRSLQLMRSGDFDLLDSLTLIDSTYYRAKIRFSNLSASQHISLIFNTVYKDGRTYNYDIRLLPSVPTTLGIKVKDDDLYTGEARIFELQSNHPENVRADNTWHKQKDFDYKIYLEDQQLRAQILPRSQGKIEMSLELSTRKPFINDSGIVSTALPIIRHSFTVRKGRLTFLNFDPKDVTLEINFGRGLEVQLENNINLQMHKTYRIEDQLEGGGTFIGELYTRSMLSNDRVLCWLRPYALHRLTDGFLYLKDGDEPRYITNFTISERMQISKVSILRDGADWSTNLSANPGETVEVRIEGTGLSKARFLVEDISELRRDSALATENVVQFKFRVPLNISKRKIVIFNAQKNTGYDIQIKEFQQPKPLDFVSFNYSGKDEPLTMVSAPRLYDKNIRDITISFQPNKIDEGGRLFGRQYLTVNISYYNNKGELTESKDVNDVLICPGDNSPRAAFYNDKDCRRNDISINQYMSRKTYDLPDWSRIEITVKHKPDAYGGQSGYSRKATIILQRHYTFDIDASLPSGLIIKRIGEVADKGFGSFTGVSLAILAQFSFYSPDKIEKLRPYKIGAGVLALNAFNFSSDNSVVRDAALVGIASLAPPYRNKKISFNLYGGFGYFIVSGKFFYVIGPGIQLSL
ncbi:MAG: hypothetical protein V4543_16635 [Bacteroidota bacterium]